MSTEYSIRDMHKTDADFFVAEVVCFRTQRTFQLHNRYGSWFIGDPSNKSETMRAPETISRQLPFDLQAELSLVKKRINGLTDNPFVVPAASVKASDNPFMT